MTLALTKFEAYGVEIDECLTKRFKQHAIMTITAANTNNSIDLGNNTGTFWTAVGGTEPGTTALASMKDIVTRSSALISVNASALMSKGLVGSSIEIISSAASTGGATSEALTVTGLLTTDHIVAVTQRVAGAGVRTKVVALTSNASSGGAATEIMTVTGLATTDTILSVTQKVKGANNLPLLSWNTQATNAITAVWSADPGANAIIEVTVQRNDTTNFSVTGWNTQAANALTVTWDGNPGAGAIVDVSVIRESGLPEPGEYTITVQNSRPNLLFKSGDAPTSYVLDILWELQDGQDPVKVAVSA